MMAYLQGFLANFALEKSQTAAFFIALLAVKLMWENFALVRSKFKENSKKVTQIFLSPYKFFRWKIKPISLINNVNYLKLNCKKRFENYPPLGDDFMF